MAITQKAIPHIFRNKYLKNSSAGGGTTYIGGTSSPSVTHTHDNKEVLDSITAIDVDSWKNKLDKSIWDKAFIIDETNNLRVKLNLIGEQEVVAYGAGSTGGGSGVVTIVDNLTSSATDCALSANQGRVLKSLIDNKSGASSWNDLTDKPTTFAPSPHNHTVTDIINLSTLLDGKAPVSHTHTIANITDLQTKLDAKADNTTLTAHTSNSTIHITAAERTNWNVAFTNNHTHSNKSVLDGITSIKVSNWDGIVTNWNKAFYFDSDNNLRVKLNLIGEQEVAAYGSGSTGGGSGAITIVDALTSSATDCALSANQGRVLKSLIDNKSGVSSWNDLTDKPSTFAPSAHNHIVTDITNLSTLLDGKAATSHTHTIANITGLQSSLDGKSASNHTHNYVSTVKVGTTGYAVSANVVTLPAYPTTLPASDVYAWAKASVKPSYSWSEIASKPTTFTPASHTHTIANITNISSASVNYANSAGSVAWGNVTGKPSYYSSNWLTPNSQLSYGANGLNYFNASLTAGSTANQNQTPTADWWHIIRMNHANSSGYYVDLGFCFHQNYAAYRRIASGTSYGWIRFLDSSNYNSYSPTLTGGGASGNWNISISGNAASASKVNSTLTFAAGAFAAKSFNGSAAVTVNVPTATSHLSNNSGFITTGATVAKANQLTTARTINGTSFNGTANITTSYWGTARNIYIQDSPASYTGAAISVNGSGNVYLRLPNSIVCGDWFRSTGSTGWYSNTYGGGIYMTDTSYVRVYNGKSFYSPANIVAVGEVTAYSSSDKRLKKNIKPITNSLDIIEKLNPVQFNWNQKAKELNKEKDERNNYGLIAQEVEENLPELIHPIYDKYKSVDYEQLIPILIQSIKDLKEEVDALKNKINNEK